MAYMINEDCISCGACEAECPNQAISEGKLLTVSTRINVPSVSVAIQPSSARTFVRSVPVFPTRITGNPMKSYWPSGRRCIRERIPKKTNPNPS
jgi:ferredoxin